MTPAPIALFVYNRPEHTKKVLEALVKNDLAPLSELYVFSDGPKRPLDATAVAAVRSVLTSIAGFKFVRVISRDSNYGLARSITQGVGELVAKHGRIIVLEDDLVTSRYFLQYMNEALELYEHDERVVSVHGYVYPTKEQLPETFFMRGADCWGWATWQRGWDIFQSDGTKLLAELEAKKLTKAFDLGGVYPYTYMLKSQIRGFNRSWAILWYASAFLSGKLTLYPGRSLVRNIGFDKSGTHTGVTDYFMGELSTGPIHIAPVPVVASAAALRAFQVYFSSWKMKIFTGVVRARYILHRIKALV